MATDGLDAASPFRLLRDSIGSGTSHNVLFIGDKRTIAEVLNLYLSKMADEIVEKKSGLMKLLSTNSKDKDGANLVPFKAEQLSELPQSRRFVYYSMTAAAKVKFTKFTINFSVLDAKTPLETRRKVYDQGCWELVYLFVHLNHRQSVVSVIREWYPELRAFVAKPRVLVGLESPQQGMVLGKHRKQTPCHVSPYQVVVSSERIFAIDYVHIKPTKPTTIQDLFSEKCINLWKDPTPIRDWMQGRAFEGRKPLFYDRVINQKSENGMYYVDFSDIKPAPDDVELFLAGESSNKTHQSVFSLPFEAFISKLPPSLLTVGTRQVSFFSCSLTSFESTKLASNYLWYLNVLVLMNNEITTLQLLGSQDKPKVMGFSNLREIHACHNKLSKLTSSIAQIPTLTLLDLRKNSFNAFPTILCSCPNLEKLDLGDNQIPAIAPEIGKLTSLKELFLNNNLLSTLPVEIGRLFNLRTLMLQHNNLHKLPLIMANLTKLTTLELNGNPLVEPPPEVLSGGLNAMRSFLSDQLRSGERSFRMKLMFVGQEAVGKTSVVKSIKRAIGGGAGQAAAAPSERPPLSTDGIDIETITMQHVDSMDQSKHVLQFTVLDFAGQEIYYATHQVFLTERAIYMVVWDLRKSPKECRVDYWLHAITAAAPKSPIFLVGTHLDDKSVDPKKTLATLDALIPQYKKRFRIRGLEMVSCIAGENISAMVTNICNTALREPTMGAKFPSSHFIFEEHLQMRRNQLKEANKAPILTYEEIRNLAIDCGVIASTKTELDIEPPTRARSGTYVPASSRIRRRYDRKKDTNKDIASSDKKDEKNEETKESEPQPLKTNSGALTRDAQGATGKEHPGKMQSGKEGAAGLVEDKDTRESEFTQEQDTILHNTLTLFHELGSIVYLGEHLDAFIILDPQWINKVFASVLTTKHNFAKDGVLEYDHVVTHLWGRNADFPPHLHSIMLDLLEHFQCVFKMQKNPNQLLVPLFLSEKRPDLSLDWPIRIPGLTEFTRLYDLGYTPVGLVGRILVTLMSEANVATYWRNGMLLYAKNNKHHMALIELVEAVASNSPNSTTTTTTTTTTTLITTTTTPSNAASPSTQTSSGLHYRLRITVRGMGCEDLFRTLVSIVDYICSAWYHLDANDQMLVKSSLCPVCVAQGIPQPTEFTLRRCEAALLASGTLTCTANPTETHTLRVDQVAPDISWTEFQSKLVDVATEVTIISEIGRGSHSTVCKATYNSDYVAMKSFGNNVSNEGIVSSALTSSKAATSAMEELKREVQFLSNLRHPNLVQIIGFGASKPPTLLLEFVPLGALSTFLNSPQFCSSSTTPVARPQSTWILASTPTVLTNSVTDGPPQMIDDLSGVEPSKSRWPLILRIAWDVAAALNDLHSAHPAIVHGNLSHRKVFIASTAWTNSVVAKVAFTGPAPNTAAEPSTEQVPPIAARNIPWSDPDLLKGGSRSVESDVFAFGVILWQLVTRLTPYAGLQVDTGLLQKIIVGERPNMTIFPTTGPASDFKALIEKCWDADRAKRPSFSLIISQLLPDIMKSGKLEEVWTACQQTQRDVQQMRSETEAIVQGVEGGAASNAQHLQDLVLGRWIANLDTSNSRVRKMLPIQPLGEVWCLTDLGHVLVFSMSSGQFLRRYNHVLPSISSFAFCSLFYSDDNVWVASNKVIAKIPNVKALSASGSGTSPASAPPSSPHSSGGFDSVYGAPIEGVLSIKDERYTKRAGWCRLANGVLHFYKRQGELMPWNVAHITDIDVIEPHFYGHTTFLLRMKDKSIYMGGGRNATLAWQEIITKQKRDLEAARTRDGVAEPVFYCSIDQRMWAVQVVDNIAWILLNDRRLVRWDLTQSAPSGYIDLHAHMKQKEATSPSAQQQHVATMAIVTITLPTTSVAQTASSPAPTAATPTTITKKILWVSMQTDIIRISVSDGKVIDVLHAPQGDISLMTFHAARNEVWTYSAGLLRIRNAVSGKSQLIVSLDRPVHSMTSIGSKMWLHLNRNIQIWNDHRVSSELEHRHESPVHDILYLEHNRTAWTCSVDAVNVWK